MRFRVSLTVEATDVDAAAAIVAEVLNRAGDAAATVDDVVTHETDRVLHFAEAAA